MSYALLKQLAGVWRKWIILISKNVQKIIYFFILFIALTTPVYSQQETTYPTKPIRIVVGSAAGGATDTVTRMVASKVSGLNSQYTFVIENVPGAGGAVGAEKVLASAADGYSLYIGNYNLIINNILGKFNHDMRMAFIPIANITAQATMLFVSTTIPVGNVNELINYAKMHPGKLNYFSTGVGSFFHLGMVNFEAYTGTRMTQITYKGASLAVNDLASGAIHLMFGSYSGLHVVRSGRAKMIAVATRQRLPEFPDVPTMIEEGIPNFNLTQLVTLYAPAGVPDTVITTLNPKFAQAASNPEVLKKFAPNGALEPPNPSPKDLKKALDNDYVYWIGVVKKSALKVN